MKKHFTTTLLALMITALGNLSASLYTFTPFEFTDGGVDSPVLDPIEISLEVTVIDDCTYFYILNSSNTSDAGITDSAPTITSIFIEDPGGTLGGSGTFDLDESTVLSGGVVSYFDSATGGNLPGGNNINFTTSFSFKPTSPVVVDGVDPGETAAFKVSDSDETTAVMNALDSGDLRVGLHVQQIGPTGASSASYATLIPEPSSVMLISLAGFATLLRRRRLRTML